MPARVPVPAQVVPAYRVKVTLPVGIPPAAVPVTVALSCTVEPIGAEVITA